MGAQLNHTVDLDDTKILEWLNSGASKPFKEEIDNEVLLAAGLTPVSGSDRKISPEDNETVAYVTATIRHYELIKTATETGKERKLQDVFVQVPVLYNLSIEIESILYIASSRVSENGRKIINNAYEQFKDQDPILFIAEALNSEQAKREGLTTSDFHVALRYTLTQVGTSTHNLDQVHALERYYKGGVEIAQDAEWFQKENIVLRYRGEKSGHRFETPTQHPILEQYAEGRADSEVLEEISDQVAGNLNCDDHYISKNHRVVTIFQWPEFKVEWYSRKIKIGCATIEIKLPKLRTRTRKKVLYANVVVALRDANDTLKNIVGDCALDSALVGGVVGIVMWNFAAALAAFRVLFENCVHMKVGQHLTCLVPSLVLITEGTEWS